MKKNNVYFFYGDEFLIKKQIKIWEESFNKKYTNLNIIKLNEIEDQHFKLEFWNELLINQGLFSSKKLVLWKNPSEFIKKLSPDILKRIKKNILSLENKNFLVLYEYYDYEKLFKNDILKELFENIIVKKIELKEDKIINLILKSLGEKDLIISQDLLDYLIFNFKDDLQKFHSELKKIYLFSKDIKLKKIKIEDVFEILDHQKIDDQFFIIDNILLKKIENLYKILDYIEISKKEKLDNLINIIIWKVRLMLKINQLKNQGVFSYYELSKKLNLRLFIIKKTLRILERYEEKKLKKIYKNLLEIDFKRKTLNIPTKELLLKFILEAYI